MYGRHLVRPAGAHARAAGTRARRSRDPRRCRLAACGAPWGPRRTRRGPPSTPP